MATVLYRGPFREPWELEESEQRVSPWTPHPALLAGVGERAPGIHLCSGDKSSDGADVTVRLRMLKLQLSIRAQGSEQHQHARILLVVDFKIKIGTTKTNYAESLNEFVEEKNLDKDSTFAPVDRQIVCSSIYRFHAGVWAEF